MFIELREMISDSSQNIGHPKSTLNSNVCMAYLHQYCLTSLPQCDSGIFSDKEEDYGLIRPSLIKQLRSILDQYPDNGQILKVS
jgi:hypothetical protein